MAQILQFQRKPSDIKPYINLEKGWKFTEDDKEFLLSYYKEYLDVLNEECGGDGAEDVQKIIDSIENNGVDRSRELIQADARFAAESVNDDIYNYYRDSANVLKLIENSILDIQW